MPGWTRRKMWNCPSSTPACARARGSGAPQIMELFGALSDEGRTIIMITHDLNIARHARRVVHIIDGELTEGKEATWA